MRGVEPPSRAWEARVIAVIRHPQTSRIISPIGMVSQDIDFPVKERGFVLPKVPIKQHLKAKRANRR